MAWLRGAMPLLLVAGGLVGAALASGGAPRRPLTHAALAQKRLPQTPPSRAGTAQRRGQAPVRPEPVELARFTARYCVACHNRANKTAGLALDVLSEQAIDRHPEAWERVVRQPRARQMPPVDQARPQLVRARVLLGSCAEPQHGPSLRPGVSVSAGAVPLLRTEWSPAS